MNFQTLRVLYWINAHDYSRNHWATVALESLVKCDQEHAKAKALLTTIIRDFHLKFCDSVIKHGNVLYDFVQMGFDEVDWAAVADAVMDGSEPPSA